MIFQRTVALGMLECISQTADTNPLPLSVFGNPDAWTMRELDDSGIWVGRWDTFSVVAFRGTQKWDVAEWIRNGDFRKTPYGVHEGFARSSALSGAAALEMLKSVGCSPQSHVYITGHSAGAAEAKLFAETFRTSKRRMWNVPIYCFGCPRVGNAEWALWYNTNFGDRTFNVVLSNDLVPRLPPWRLGFRHAGRAVYIDRNHKIHPDARPSRYWKDRLAVRLHDILRPGLSGLRMHGRDAYYRALLGIEQKAAKGTKEVQVAHA